MCKRTTSLNNIKNGKTLCSYCANKASHTIEVAKQVAFGKMVNAFPKHILVVFHLYYDIVLKDMIF